MTLPEDDQIEDQDQVQDDVQDDENEPEEIDYQKLYNEKLAELEHEKQTSRNHQRDKDIVTSRLNKFNKELQNQGIGKVEMSDTGIDLVIYSKKTEDDPMKSIEEEIRSLDKKYDDDDIDTKEYNKRMIALELKKERILASKTNPPQQEPSKTETNMYSEEAIRNEWEDIVKTYPDSRDESSELFKVMSSFIGKPGFDNADHRFNKNPYERRRLIEAALNKMQKGDPKVQTPKTPQHSFDSKPTRKDPPKKDVLQDYEQRGVIRVTGVIKNQEALDRIKNVVELYDKATPDEIMNNRFEHK